MPTDVSRVVRVLLRCDQCAPGIAREALREVEELARVRDDALLVSSELVSNAVLHAGCDSTDDIELVAEVTDGAVLITVTDGGFSGDTPVIRHSPPSQAGGMGMRLVAMLARRWGAYRNGGLHVWAELAL